MSNEKDHFGNHEQGFNAERIGEAGNEQRERLAEQLERNVENSKHENVEKVRHEALEKASQVEADNERQKQKHETIDQSPAERRNRPISRREKEASFTKTMTEVQSQMSSPSRAFSKIIHNPVVERTSDFVGGTLARPNAVLTGAIFAFLFTLGVYLIARSYGYSLSGSETIASFALGWIIGIAFDYVRLLILGKK